MWLDVIMLSHRLRVYENPLQGLLTAEQREYGPHV